MTTTKKVVKKKKVTKEKVEERVEEKKVVEEKKELSALAKGNPNFCQTCGEWIGIWNCSCYPDVF